MASHSLTGINLRLNTKVAAPAMTQAKFSASAFLRAKWKYISFAKPSTTGASAAVMMPKGEAIAEQAMPATKWIIFILWRMVNLSL